MPFIVRLIAIASAAATVLPSPPPLLLLLLLAPLVCFFTTLTVDTATTPLNFGPGKQELEY